MPIFIKIKVHLAFGTKLGLVVTRSYNFQVSSALLETALFHRVSFQKNCSTFKFWEQIGPNR